MSKTTNVKRFAYAIPGLVLLLIASGCCPRPLVMEANAYRAELVVTNAPTVMARGEKKQLRVNVKNISGTVWHTNGLDPSYKLRSSDDDMYRMYLGNHWLDNASEKTVIPDDGRAALPEVLEPGGSATISIAINAPPNPGEYILELDLVQENVTWFAGRGSQTAKYKVRVE